MTKPTPIAFSTGDVFVVQTHGDGMQLVNLISRESAEVNARRHPERTRYAWAHEVVDWFTMAKDFGVDMPHEVQRQVADLKPAQDQWLAAEAERLAELAAATKRQQVERVRAIIGSRRSQAEALADLGVVDAHRTNPFGPRRVTPESNPAPDGMLTGGPGAGGAPTLTPAASTPKEPPVDPGAPSTNTTNPSPGDAPKTEGKGKKTT